jgi:two-component system response regulator
MHTMGTGAVLLVEDNSDDEMLALRAFKKNNVDYPLVVARDGQEAIDYLFNPANALPVLILLDLKLPKLDGIDVLKKLRANKRTNLVPVIILTSSSQEDDIRASYASGANSYLRKPLDLGRFMAAIGAIANYWLNYNEVPSVGGDQ